MAITIPQHPKARYYTDPTGASFLVIVVNEHANKKGVVKMVDIHYYDNRGGGRHARATKKVCVYAHEVRPTGENMTEIEWGKMVNG